MRNILYDNETSNELLYSNGDEYDNSSIEIYD
jgi:hypothetical protein